MSRSVPDPGLDAQLRALQQFRRELYACFDAWSDTLFELVDALLVSAQRPSSLPWLTLEAPLRRGHGSVYKALTKARIVDDLLEDITARHIQADVPLGALLSGGLDSSALVALGQRAAHRGGMPPLRTFSVDFAGNADHFTGTGLRSTPDAPFVRDVAAHCGVDHHDIVLDAAELTDSRHRQAVVTAKDAPALGDIDTSLYLFFRAVREHTTVVLSGESADEVFGGYPWFHDADRVHAHDYPWRYFTGHSGTYQALLRNDVTADLGIAAHREAHYRQALAEVPRLAGETGSRMREVTYLHLTRWLPHLLDRKDRLSMAAGLEVRVPFCDHRLVEYAFNTPWTHHSFDNREKSLLRAAVAPLLPASVIGRTKAPYPVTHDPAYHRMQWPPRHSWVSVPGPSVSIGLQSRARTVVMASPLPHR